MALRDQAHPNPHNLKQLKGTAPQMVGRYPHYDVLSQVDHWDEVTRRVVLDRVNRVPPIRFFTLHEAETLKAFCDIAPPQDEEPRIPFSPTSTRSSRAASATAGNSRACRGMVRCGAWS